MHAPKIRLAKSWPATVRSAMIHVIALARFATIHTQSRAANHLNERVRLKAENNRLHAEVLLLQEEIRIKHARMERIDAHKRPRYPSTERMAILELRAARGWSQQQTAKVFQITASTIASWCKRLGEEGPQALVQLREPANRFPDFVRYAVQRLKVLCPSMGKVKMAQILARAGLHLGATTVGRIVKEKPPDPRAAAMSSDEELHIAADCPNHVWHVDLTTVPVSGGFWTPWSPSTLPQSWPFCWWVAIVLDQYSRRVMGFAVFPDMPTSVAIRSFLGRTIKPAAARPKYVICDKGVQFWCGGFKVWCRRRKIKPRYGAVGKHGSIAVIERFIGTMKREGTHRLLIPLRRATFRNELQLFVAWYNAHRPHSALDGCTPHEVYHDLPATNRRPRCEPRSGWPRRSNCATPQTLVAGQPGARFSLTIDFVQGRKHLPIVSLKRAA